MQSTWADAKPLTEQRNRPLHQQLRGLIREKILSGQLVDGALIPPEVELAQLYGVSRTTARHAILELVREDLLHRVPGQGTFVRRQASRSLRPVTVICSFLDLYIPELIDGIEGVLSKSGYDLLIRNSKKDVHLEANHIQEAFKVGSAGVILWPKSPEFGTVPSKALQDLFVSSIPVVIVDQFVAGRNAVTSDHFGGAYLLANHLIDRGYSRIGFVTHHAHLPPSVQARWNGLKEASLNAGLALEPSFLFRNWPNTTDFEAWLDARRPEVLMCANDITAIEVMSLLPRLGVRVPEDMGVAGYDDIPLAATFHPPLTTVKQDFRAIGQSAARMLLNCFQRPDTAPTHLSLPVQLQVRASCGANTRPVPGFDMKGHRFQKEETP